MKPLSSMEIQLCKKQAKIFEASIKSAEYSSPIFIRRFMYSSVAKSMDDELFLYTSNSVEDVFAILDQEFGKSSYGKEKYSEEQMYWIGYIYRCLSIKYHLSSKSVYKLFNAKDIVKYYNICHTFDIVDAAERMMESISYDSTSIEQKAYNLMKRFIYRDILNQYLNKTVTVIMDNEKENLGQFPDFKTPDNEIQKVYVLDRKKGQKEFNGKVIAAIERDDDSQDILVVCDTERNYTKDEIIKRIHLENVSKSKIITAKVNKNKK